MLNFKIFTLFGIAILNAWRTKALYDIQHVTERSEVYERMVNDTDPKTWCATLNPEDADKAQSIWEDWGVGYWMSFFLQKTINPVDEHWPYYLFKSAVGGGDQGESNCGTIGAGCTFNISCDKMVKKGYSSAYWILVALENFQSNLNFVHSALQDAVINDTLAINSLFSDFSTPSQYQVASGIKAFISASFFISGGAAGSTTLGTSKLAGARMAELGPARVALREALESEDESAIAIARAQVNAINRDIANLKGTSKVSSVSGALIYLAAPVFALSVNVNVNEQGEIAVGDLAESIYDMFTASVQNMVTIGELATGNAQNGNYSALPGQTGVHGVLPNPDPIEDFFSDGKFLMGLTNSTMADALNSFYQLFRTKLVDIALQGGNYQIIAETNLDTKGACERNVGAAWIDSHCLRLWRYYHYGVTCRFADGPIDNKGNGQCSYAAASQDDFDNIAKYGLDLNDYITGAYHCAKRGNGTPDLTNFPLDGSLPLCWYNIKTYNAYFARLQVGLEGFNQHLDLKDWSVTTSPGY